MISFEEFAERDSKPESQRVYRAVNWNENIDSFTQMFFDANTTNMWLDKEHTPAKDQKSWSKLSEDERDTYKRVLGGLTLLDTQQSIVGMPKVMEHVDGLQRKSMLSFMAMMETIHAKSYSTIFTTLIPSSREINEVFEWVEENPRLQTKAEMVTYYYENIVDKKTLYLSMVASVYLESFLFYSGFFYPLYLSGQGKMKASGEIINLIIRDESLHGVYVGMLAQELYQEFTEEEKEEVDSESKRLMDELLENEFRYTEEIYGKVGLVHQVKDFVLYNANKAMMNLGKEAPFEHKDVEPAVINGLDTQAKANDFFSIKGSYVKAVFEPLEDEDFVFTS